MQKKVLFTATVDSHILQFHIPFLRYFKDSGYEVHVATNSDLSIPYCDKKIKIPFERSPFRINNIRSIYKLKKIITDEKYEIIHTHTPVGSVVTRLAAKKARKKYGTKVIYTAHGFHFYKGASKINWLIFYPIEKYLAKITDDLITINMEDYNLTQKKFKTSVHYIPGVGIDEAKFTFNMTEFEKNNLKKSLGLKKDDFILIYPAEISKRKRQVWLINTLDNLLVENSNIHLLLPGKDSLNGKCQKIVKKLNLEQQIHFLGYRNDIPRLLKISDIAISSAKQEGLPVNIMEAMYVNLPIVASNCRGNRDLIENNMNGFLIDINDNYKFSSSIKKILLNPNLCKSLKNSNKTIIKKYLLNEIMPLMIEIYTGEKNEK